MTLTIRSVTLLDGLVERLALDLALAERVRLEARGQDVLRELDAHGGRLGVVALVGYADGQAGERTRLPFARLDGDVRTAAAGKTTAARTRAEMTKRRSIVGYLPLDGYGDVLCQEVELAQQGLDAGVPLAGDREEAPSAT